MCNVSYVCKELNTNITDYLLQHHISGKKKRNQGYLFICPRAGIFEPNDWIYEQNSILVSWYFFYPLHTILIALLNSGKRERLLFV